MWYRRSLDIWMDSGTSWVNHVGQSQDEPESVPPQTGLIRLQIPPSQGQKVVLEQKSEEIYQAYVVHVSVSDHTEEMF